ncbi:hypothetical protein WA171_002745 [Blastocystis sp. BT1]
MQTDNIDTVQQIRNIINENDPTTIQYLIPAYKLLRCSFAENSNSVTTKEDLVLISDTLQYLVAASSNKEMEKHMVSEASLIVCNTICDIQDYIPKDDETYDRFLSLLIRLLNERREDNSVSFSILVYLQRLSSDVLRIPKPLMADLCKICSSILAQPDQSRNSLCTMTLSMVCMLMQLADNMDWFVNNGIIFQLSVLFTRECTVAMCRFFLVILNQIVSNEAYHPELLRSIGVTVILNCIRTFVPEAASNEDYYRIVELCFLYLLRLFVSDTQTVIQTFPEQVSELLHFLYEALFSPYYSQSGQGVQTIPGAVIQMEVHSQDMILSDYVMSLFALLYYNSADPEIVQAATVSEVCHRLNEISSFNIILFLHQFLFFCISKDPTLIPVLEQEENIAHLLHNFYKFPSESMLTLFSYIIHYHMASQSEAELKQYYQLLASLRFPSMLINVLMIDTLPLTISESVDLQDSIRSGDTNPSDSSGSVRAVSNRVQVIILDILDALVSDRSTILLEDSTLIYRLLELMRNSLQSRDSTNQKIFHLSSRLLIAISLHSQNFALISQDSRYITSLCELLLQAPHIPDMILQLFCPLYQYAQYGSMQRLVSDSKFSKLMAQTRRLLSDSSGLLQSWTSLNQQGDNTIRSVLTMTLGLVKVIKVLSSRYSSVHQSQYPVMGDVFQFLASVISTTVCETIISICVESCEQLWNCGAPTIQERLRGDIREAFVILLEKPFLQGECRSHVSALLSLTV